MLTHICLSLAYPSITKPLLFSYKSPSFWLISAYHSLLIDLLTHSLLILCLSHCLLITYKPPIVLLPIPSSFTNIAYSPPCVYKLLLAVCQCKQSVPCFKAVLKMSLSFCCALSVHFCQPLSSLWVWYISSAGLKTQYLQVYLSYSSTSLCPRLKWSPGHISVVLLCLCKLEEPLLFCCINPLGVVPSLVQLLSHTTQANHYSFFVFRCCVWVVELVF